MVPELLLVGAGHVWDDELDVLLHELALLPGHGLALVSPGPDLRKYLDFEIFKILIPAHLLAVVVCLPECDAVLLRDVLALGEKLFVGDRLLALVAAFLDKQLGRQLLLLVLLGLETHLALLVRHHLALGLRHVNANVLLLGLAHADWKNLNEEQNIRMNCRNLLNST